MVKVYRPWTRFVQVAGDRQDLNLRVNFGRGCAGPPGNERQRRRQNVRVVVLHLKTADVSELVDCGVAVSVRRG